MSTVNCYFGYRVFDNTLTIIERWQNWTNLNKVVCKNGLKQFPISWFCSIVDHAFVWFSLASQTGRKTGQTQRSRSCEITDEFGLRAFVSFKRVNLEWEERGEFDAGKQPGNIPTFKTRQSQQSQLASFDSVHTRQQVVSLFVNSTVNTAKSKPSFGEYAFVKPTRNDFGVSPKYAAIFPNTLENSGFKTTVWSQWSTFGVSSPCLNE